MFSVEDEDEAERLIVLACDRNLFGQYVARELVDEQTLENLEAFGDRLEGLYNRYIRSSDGE